MYHAFKVPGQIFGNMEMRRTNHTLNSGWRSFEQHMTLFWGKAGLLQDFVYSIYGKLMFSDIFALSRCCTASLANKAGFYRVSMDRFAWETILGTSLLGDSAYAIGSILHTLVTTISHTHLSHHADRKQFVVHTYNKIKMGYNWGILFFQNQKVIA
jgi:hypothetical protein